MNTYELDPITPGEILFEEFLQPSNINQSTLATKIGVPANRISQIIHGKREISPDTALRLGKFFGIEPEFWLNLQMNYDLKLTKKQIYPQILAIQAISNDYHTNA
jgi:addiction module HigA family antidote